MAFRYCHAVIDRKTKQTCDYEFYCAPTMREDLDGGQICPKCDAIQPVWQTTEQWMLELEERIETLERESPKRKWASIDGY